MLSVANSKLAGRCRVRRHRGAHDRRDDLLFRSMMVYIIYVSESLIIIGFIGGIPCRLRSRHSPVCAILGFAAQLLGVMLFGEMLDWLSVMV